MSGTELETDPANQIMSILTSPESTIFEPNFGPCFISTILLRSTIQSVYSSLVTMRME